MRGLLVIIVFALSGCAGQVIKLPVVNNQARYGFNFVDARPATEKSYEILSYSVSSCDYGTYRFGDEKFQPSHIEFLKNQLQSSAGDALAGKTVTLKHFTVFDNQRHHLIGSNIFATNSIVGKLVGATVTADSCNDKNVAGRYASDENPNDEMAAVVEIELQIGGQTLKARSVKHAGQPEVNVDSRMELAIKGAVDQILFEAIAL